MHPFVAAELPRWLAIELLQKAHNPQHSYPPELEVSDSQFCQCIFIGNDEETFKSDQGQNIKSALDFLP